MSKISCLDVEEGSLQFKYSFGFQLYAVGRLTLSFRTWFPSVNFAISLLGFSSKDAGVLGCSISLQSPSTEATKAALGLLQRARSSHVHLVHRRVLVSMYRHVKHVSPNL